MEERVIDVKLLSLLKGKEIRLFPHRKNKIILHQSSCFLLEMEDVLFHSGSAVMMPDNPEGRSSRDGEGVEERQVRVCGVRALSLVFRHLQLHPEHKLLICGHTDRSGDIAYNFKLSGLRARGVYLLLVGKREEWAELSASKHKIEDYQQIMKYYSLMNGWKCDPGLVDNKWGPKTEQAIREFIISWNTLFYHKAAGAQELDVAIVDEIRRSPDHLWPKAMWEAVYDLYELDLRTTVCGKEASSEKFALQGARLIESFVDPDQPWLACGESFPKDERPNVRYRSQRDRRVELLFFDPAEIPMLDCPERINSVHTQKECPLRRGNCFHTEYIDATTYFTAEYHLKFEYYDRIKKERIGVPVCFPILAWKEGNIPLETKVRLESDCTLTVTVLGITHSPREDDVHFTFETPEQYYLFTEISDSNPIVVTESQLKEQLLAERDSLPADKRNSVPLTFGEMPFSRRLHYYDLPRKWDSRNWFCRKGSREGFWKEISVEETTTSEPICISFDDVVLVTEKNGKLEAIVWNETYRFTAFSSTMEINNPDPDYPWFTLGTSQRNALSHLITGEHLRAIALSGRIYDITNVRTTEGEIVGARAAVLNDKRVHVRERRREPVASICGHYDLHYFSECIDKDGNPCSVLLVHWIAHLQKGVGNVSDADLDNFRRLGFSGCKERWEKKGYWMEPELDPKDKKIKVEIRYFFEENSQVTQPHCIVKISDPADPNFRSNMGLDTAEFSKETFEENPSDAGAWEDNNTFYWFTMAHELGHAIGLDDEYVEPIPGTGWRIVLPQFEQYYDGMPYSTDINSMMVENRAPRLRHLWIQCRWLNENEEVRKLTGNTVFCVKHKGYQGGSEQEFKYYLPPQVANFYKALFEKKNFRNNTNGKFDLFLYRLGQDELTNKDYVKLVANQTDFDGILVVRVNIVWEFKNHTGNDESQWITEENKIERMRNFQDDIMTLLNNKFWMEKTNPDNNLSKIYIYFLPHHRLGGAMGSTAHFKITVRQDNPITGDPPSEIFSGNSLIVGNSTNNIAIFRYMLGLNYKNKDDILITTIRASDLDCIRKWVEDKTNSSYILYEVGSV